jgi:hypothetical protein
MLALKLFWPDGLPASEGMPVVVVDEYLIKSALQDNNVTLYDPSTSPSEFLQVSIYDNSVKDESTGLYVRVTSPPAEADRVYWDATIPAEDVVRDGFADGKMFVDATSNVDDNHHRIILLAERQPWNLSFPVELALRATSVDSNGQGLGIEIEVPPDGTGVVLYDVGDTQGKGLDIVDTNIQPNTDDPMEFGDVITEGLLGALESIARQKGTYFEDDVEASDYLEDNATTVGGSVVYIRSTSSVDISCSEDIASAAKPVVIVIDTPDSVDNSWTMLGGTKLYGVLVCLGNGELAGSPSVHGALYVEGTLLNSGNGADEELAYNYDVIKNINRQYTTSVNIVANTWEEYTGGE